MGMVEVVIHKDRAVTKVIPDSLRGLTKELAYTGFAASASLASRAVRVASSLLKNQRVVVSCRPPRYRRKHGRRLFFIREISCHLQMIC